MRFIIGKARTGKTGAIIGEIRTAVQERRGRQILIVPEQYSHEAERELCAACGDSLSLYAEVMSFSGLARWCMTQFGGGARPRMDKGGKLLCVAVALRELRPLLQRYATAAEHADLQVMFLRELETLRAAGADRERLRELAEETEPALGEKLRELAAVQEAYETVTARSGAAPEEALEYLAGQIMRFGLPEVEHVYVDGFLDFTGLEMKVLEAMLRRNVDLTVCLPGDLDGGAEEYMLPSRIAMEQLRRLAEENGQRCRTEEFRRKDDGQALGYYTDNMFRFDVRPAVLAGRELRLLRTEHPRAECEAAAALILQAVREEGCRWRDIAVAVRGFEDYRLILESCFRRYGIPLFVTEHDALTDRSFPNWIESAYEIVLGNWDTEEMTAYLRCGLSGLSEERCDELCAYLRRWRLKASDWLRNEDWKQHPDGYGKEVNAETFRRLRQINRARRKIAEPLLFLREASAAAGTAREQAEALAEFLRRTRASRHLEERAENLDRSGTRELRAEYLQLWDKCTGAIAQIAAILGDAEMNAQEFRELLHAMLSQIEVGLIPVSLDRVSAGDFDRMRRRNIRKLIVLGCTDDRLPRARSGSGLFSAEERDILAEHDLMIGGGDKELWREYALIYHTLSLPREQLILSCPDTDGKGDRTMPALVYNQAGKIFSITPERISVREARLSAEKPALGLAVRAGRPGSGTEESAAAEWFHEHDPALVERIRSAARTERGSLSPAAIEALYGKRLHISPSRMEKFASCRFAYYCQYGLKAEPDEPSDYRAPEIGSFIHLILEGVAREVKERGGFAEVSDDELREITDRHIREYVRTELNNFEEKSTRFRHLFERLCRDVYRIVADLTEELRRSDFEPLSFELDISRLSEEKPVQDGSIRLTGIADRVDGWIRDGEICLRVVDYKSGMKKFSLSDVLSGHNMQMLLYLFTISDQSEALYGLPGKSAGILYLPARDTVVSFDSAPEPEQVEQEKKKSRRRSGIMLDEKDLIEAWEKGGTQDYIPIRTRSVNPLVSLEQMGILRRNVEKTLTEMGKELLRGSISANPEFRNAQDNACVWCEFAPVCQFREGENGEHSRQLKQVSEEEAWELLRERSEDGE